MFKIRQESQETLQFMTPKNKHVEGGDTDFTVRRSESENKK